MNHTVTDETAMMVSPPVHQLMSDCLLGQNQKQQTLVIHHLLIEVESATSDPQIS
jgi:hypothetical protein